MSRQDQYAVTFNVDGRDLGVWDKLEGGEVDSEEAKYKPGAMGAHISLGGSVEVGNLTISRLYRLDRDHEGATGIHWLLSRVGKGNCTINRQPLDTDGNAFGRPLVYTGKLKTVTPPDVDSESGDAAVLECEITPAGTVGAWIQFFQRTGDKPIPTLFCPTAVMAAEAFPYLKSGQLQGMLNGLSGAIEYEVLTGEKGFGTRASASLSYAHLLIILLIVLGNAGMFAERYLRQAQEKGGR